MNTIQTDQSADVEILQWPKRPAGFGWRPVASVPVTAFLKEEGNSWTGAGQLVQTSAIVWQRFPEAGEREQLRAAAQMALTLEAEAQKKAAEIGRTAEEMARRHDAYQVDTDKRLGQAELQKAADRQRIAKLERDLAKVQREIGDKAYYEIVNKEKIK